VKQTLLKHECHRLVAAWRHRTKRSQELWGGNLECELTYWDGWLRSRGYQWPTDFIERLDPDSTLQQHIGQFLSSHNPRIVDVGAGPLTFLGKRWNGRPLQIVPVDPLAEQYADLLKEAGIQAPVPTTHAEAEKLSQQFGHDVFDLAYARNCLDHSYDPIESVRQMVTVTKPGGYVLLEHRLTEGFHVHYHGLHQWDFWIHKGDSLMLSSPGRSTVNITRILAGTCLQVECERTGEWFFTAFRKHCVQGMP
jgi:SAM-dependent methyltransferase